MREKIKAILIAHNDSNLKSNSAIDLIAAKIYLLYLDELLTMTEYH
jgi:hypothetical protein